MPVRVRPDAFIHPKCPTIAARRVRRGALKRSRSWRVEPGPLKMQASGTLGRRFCGPSGALPSLSHFAHHRARGVSAPFVSLRHRSARALRVGSRQRPTGCETRRRMTKVDEAEVHRAIRLESTTFSLGSRHPSGLTDAVMNSYVFHVFTRPRPRPGASARPCTAAHDDLTGCCTCATQWPWPPRAPESTRYSSHGCSPSWRDSPVSKARPCRRWRMT